MITSANAARRTSSASGSSGSGSWNTNGPAAIVSTFAVALVRAITGTTGPICSERAETSSPTRLSVTITSANGWMTTARPRPSALPVSALIVTSLAAQKSPADTASAGPLWARRARTSAASVAPPTVTANVRSS